MKRIVILVLIISFLMIPTAQADNAPMRKLTLQATISGEELDVCFYADLKYENKTTAFESLDFELSYSSEVLELIECVKTENGPESDIIDGSFIMEEVTDEPGRYGLHAASAFGNAGTGLLVHLRFRIIGEGYYGFRLGRDCYYSVYDTAANQSNSYHLPRLDIDAELSAQTRQTEQIPGATSVDSITVKPTTAQKESWFMRLIHSIFGTSCSCGSK